jgi:hypothetical protein
VEGVTVDENSEQSGVNFRVVGDFTNLVIGEISGVLLFLCGHNRDSLTQLLQFLGSRTSQHTKLANFDIVLKLLAHELTVFVSGKLRQLVEVLAD